MVHPHSPNPQAHSDLLQQLRTQAQDLHARTLDAAAALTSAEDRLGLRISEVGTSAKQAASKLTLDLEAAQTSARNEVASAREAAAREAEALRLQASEVKGAGEALAVGLKAALAAARAEAAAAAAAAAGEAGEVGRELAGLKGEVAALRADLVASVAEFKGVRMALLCCCVGR